MLEARFPPQQQAVSMPNLRVNALNCTHPSFSEAWPDPIQPVPSNWATIMSVLIPKVALEATTYLAKSLVVRRDVLFHRRMEQQIKFDLDTWPKIKTGSSFLMLIESELQSELK